MDHRSATSVREPALDGIRALAVIAVLLYHGHVSWMRGGFLGVDAFFVLSGYLITALLVAEWRTSGAIDLKAFWVRRARRLLPALLAVVAAVIAYAAWFAPRGERSGLRGDTLATLAYAANWRAIAVGNSYGDLFSAPSPLQHVWSLAIEEQWYLLWPILLVGLLWLARRFIPLPMLAVAGIAIVGAIGSALAMAALYSAEHSGRAYYGTDTRCQSLLVGAALALAFGHARATGRPRRVHPMLTVAAIVAVVTLAWAWSATPLQDTRLYRGGFFFFALLVAAVIAAATRPGPVRTLLSVRPLPQIGLVSYGLYLWHWPVFVVLSSTHTGLDGLPLLSLRLAVTALVATISFVALEQPVRAGTLRLPHPRLTAPAILGIVVVTAIVATQGGRPTVAFAEPTAAPPTTQAFATAPTSPTKVAVVGDSVAFTMGAGLTRVGPSAGLDVWDQGLLGCGILRGTMWIEGAVHEVSPKCSDWPTRFRDLVDEWRPQIVVLLMGAWDAYDVRIDDEWIPFGTPRHDDFVLDEVRQAVEVLGSRGAQVVLLTTPYFEPRHDVVDRDRSAFNPERVDHLNALLRQVQGVTVFDLNRFLAPEGRFANDLYGVTDVRGDGVHFTAEGEDLVGRWLAPKLAALEGCVQGVRNCSIVAASSDGRS